MCLLDCMEGDDDDAVPPPPQDRSPRRLSIIVIVAVVALGIPSRCLPNGRIDDNNANDGDDRGTAAGRLSS